MTLKKTAKGLALVADVQAYLHLTLGAQVCIEPWAGSTSIPADLFGAFDLHELKLCSKEILLARSRSVGLPPLRRLRAQLDELERIAHRPTVLVLEAVTSFERRRLVERRIPFIVPGNQLYLPDLGVDFREHFRRPIEPLFLPFAPATQAIFIAALLRGEWRDGWDPAQLSSELGYTPMTLTRAVRELAAAGLMMVHRKGRVRRLELRHAPAQAWELATPLLRTPVKACEWVDRAELLEQVPAPLAGLSALASWCRSSEPEVPTHAVSARHWQRTQQLGIQTLPERQPGTCQCEIWSYTPLLFHDRKIADPLSLTLSLQSNEGVRGRLKTLRRNMPWA